MNATAETFLLTRELARRLERRRVAVPVFIAPSAADPILGASDSVLCTVQENRRRFAHLRTTSVCMKIRTLLVEDDLSLATTVVTYLGLEDVECDHAANGKAGFELLDK